MHKTSKNRWLVISALGTISMYKPVSAIDGLMCAKDQFILSIHTSAIYRGGIGQMSTNIVACSLGPYEINFDDVDFVRGAWSAEKIAVQNLAVALDTCLEEQLGKGRLNNNSDIVVFVRCLRNAFTHNPYAPKWVLTSLNYRRSYSITNDWNVDLTNRHETDVDGWDYRHASGLLLLVNIVLSTANKT